MANRQPDGVSTTQCSNSQLPRFQNHIELIHFSEQLLLLWVKRKIDKLSFPINNLDIVLDKKRGIAKIVSVDFHCESFPVRR